jgi:hypothetical protein
VNSRLGRQGRNQARMVMVHLQGASCRHAWQGVRAPGTQLAGYCLPALWQLVCCIVHALVIGAGLLLMPPWYERQV